MILRTDDAAGLSGHGFVFTIGRGNEVQTSACAALSRLVVGRDVLEVANDLGAFARSLTADSQLRWLGPEKGVIHMAIGAIVNAAWDMAARLAGKPVWQLIADMSPEQIVALIDFRYISDVLCPAEALAILRAAEEGKSQRKATLCSQGYPAYTTSPGWLGYSDKKLARLAAQAVTEGFRTIKLKVGLDVQDDVRRCRLAREVIGPTIGLAVDANQRWDVCAAIDWLKELRTFDLAWVEEPTSPDDVLGHAAIRRAIAPIPVSTGEHTQNRIIFKQLFQAKAVDLIQIDAARVGGVNENLAILLMAAKYGVRVFPQRRRSGPVRTRATSRDGRLRCHQRKDGGPGNRVRRPFAPTFPRAGANPRGPLPSAADARLLGRDATRFPGPLRLPEWSRVAAGQIEDWRGWFGSKFLLAKMPFCRR